MALLSVLVSAILSISDGTQKTAASDQERNNTIGDAQSGIGRIADNLRNACAFFGAGSAGSAGFYCRTNFTQAPGTSACSRSSDCVDFILDARTAVARPTGTATRTLTRVRIDCGHADPVSAALSECARYAATCTSISCPSPSTLTGVLVRAVTNGGATGSPANVFVYCTSQMISSASGAPGCSATPATADAVQVSLAVARRGTLRVVGPGNRGSFYLQAGAALRNIDQDTAP